MTRQSIRGSVRSAMELANEHGFESIAFPLIGAGTGGGSPETVLEMMQDELTKCEFDGIVRVVRFHG